MKAEQEKIFKDQAAALMEQVEEARLSVRYQDVPDVQTRLTQLGINHYSKESEELVESVRSMMSAKRMKVNNNQLAVTHAIFSNVISD